MGSKSTRKQQGHTKNQQVCGDCKNFARSGKNKGRCSRKDKRRSANDAACGHFKKA